MRIALTGVSGFIGSEIARRLAADGHTVTGLVRPSSRRDHIEPYVERFAVGDHADDRCWDELLEGAECVVHNSLEWELLSGRKSDFDVHLQTNLVGSLRLLKASAPRQFIFVSTIAVHHDMRPRWGGRIDEDHPLRPGTDYGAYKAAVEAHLWSEHFRDGRHTASVRPCAVYGIDPKLERTVGYPIVRRIRDGKSFSKPGGGKFVHVEDVAATISAIVGNEAAAGKAYNLADCYARWADWARLAGELLGVDVQIDFSSPEHSKNRFVKDAACSLGIPLDRGHEGIRRHLVKLIDVMPPS
ncbi:MAG: NAD(P)-dependent oxidoreductase [Planctomycetes bacterium]|nr:NAD(P)-dependent oxidoreductase [Planctomycetota bacterium]